jgi:hypothetical protein
MIFPTVLHNFKFCLLVLAGANAPAQEPDIVFNCYNVQQLSESLRHFTVSLDDVALLNPNTGTCPVFFWRKSADITKAVYRRIPILNRESAENEWDLAFFTMFHMSGDSGHFRTHDFEDALPLYEAKMMHQYNHRFSSYEHLAEGERSHMLPENDASKLKDARFTGKPCYHVPSSEVQSRLERRNPNTWLLGYREISSAGLQRTTIYSFLPRVGTNHKIPLVDFGAGSKSLVSCFASCMNSFQLDFLARQKLGGASFSFFVMKQLPVVPPSTYRAVCPWKTDSPMFAWIDPRVMELTYTAWDLEAFALDYFYDGPPFRWDEERRFLLRCELDAAYFHLYLGASEEWGNDSPQLREMFPTPRHAVEYIMETFPIVKRKDIKRTTITDENGQVTKPGTYITKDTILSIYDAMTESIRTGVPYQTRLDPPPGPPTDADGNFIPISEWSPSNWPSHIHPRRNE